MNEEQGSKSKRTRWIILGLVLLLIAGVGVPVYRNIFYWSGSFTPPESFDQLMQDWSSLDNVPGVILHIEKDQETIYSDAYGYESLESENNLTTQTLFHTASVGKIFTSIALLKLVEKDVVSLDEPIAPYVDADLLDGLLIIDGTDYSSEITFRQLATHHSGLPNLDTSLRFQYWILSKPKNKRTPEELINFSRIKDPVGKPGETFAYSSTGFSLLGLAMEGATGRAYHEIVRDEVFDPLDMTDTFESNRELPLDLKTSQHYLGYIKLAQNIDPSFEFADGGFVTTAADLSKLGDAIAQKTLFETDEIDLIFNTVTAEGAGFGFYWGETDAGSRYLFQPGFWGVRFVVFPEDKLNLIFTLNQSNSMAQRFLWQSIDVLIEEGHIN